MVLEKLDIYMQKKKHFSHTFYKNQVKWIKDLKCKTSYKTFGGKQEEILVILNLGKDDLGNGTKHTKLSFLQKSL